MGRLNSVYSLSLWAISLIVKHYIITPLIILILFVYITPIMYSLDYIKIRVQIFYSLNHKIKVDFPTSIEKQLAVKHVIISLNDRIELSIIPPGFCLGKVCSEQDVIRGWAIVLLLKIAILLEFYRYRSNIEKCSFLKIQ